ncbi:lycopene cyclase domain-containing protein [Chroogloeocystis siderophila]|uniref:Beta-cyclase n=1 Tax=Chroogloeocystis siderophila 5.2 s.c.1 TaxID=247279 RepID=A0A1U7I084_9CHRO|nr:lycopene cyclase domain-containing protein [Chroogloeocystis siderophila]OKH29267.1 beta-cyclase [Chroogloeocystis siderophila 5.2 s.c.1]
MSYFVFHLLFVLPPILFLAWRQPQPLAGVGGRRATLGLPLIAIVAFIYTTPWDNYLVWRKVWNYGSDRVLGTIGYVPIEEYLFFILQCILTGLWLYWLLARQPKSNQQQAYPFLRVLLLVIGVSLSVVGFLMLRSPSTVYLGLILAWAAPVITLQWVIGAATLQAMQRILLIATVVPTLYLWIIDRIAIGDGIWQISEMYTTGIELFGLPIEEAIFFLVTNIMVVQGLLLLLLLKLPKIAAITSVD